MMREPADVLTASVSAISHFYVGDTTLREALRQVAELARQTIAGADVVSVVMVVDGQPRLSVSTDGAALEIDNAQYEAGAGPGDVVLRSRKVLRVDMTEGDPRWPAFRRAAASSGILSSLSVPLIAHGEGIGAINCYSYAGGAFSADTELIGSQFAAAAAIALANAQAYWEARHLSERIGLAMKSQATVEQAKGILIAKRRCLPDQAWEILVDASRRERCDVADIAGQIVSHCWQPSEQAQGHATELAT